MSKWQMAFSARFSPVERITTMKQSKKSGGVAAFPSELRLLKKANTYGRLFFAPKTSYFATLFCLKH
jgi:hypothetical protein